MLPINTLAGRGHNSAVVPLAEVLGDEPDRAMRWTVRGFWIAMALALAARVAWEAVR